MESFFSRYKNPLLLMAVLFIQVIMLATQIKRPDDPKNPGSSGTRLIRVWAVNIVTPIERTFIGVDPPAVRGDDLAGDEDGGGLEPRSASCLHPRWNRA